MKITKKFTSKIVICAVLAFAGLLAVMGGSYAAYTSQDSQRAVVRNRDNEIVRFTSNYLNSCSSQTEKGSYKGRNVLFNKDGSQDSLSVDIFVYNYANGNEGLVSQKDITYTMAIVLNDTTGTAYSVKVDDGQSQTISLNNNEYKIEIANQTLTGRSANFHKYTVTFPITDIDKMKITAEAIPDNYSVTSNQKLAAIIAPCTGSTTNTFRGEGKFIYEKNSTPAEYKGFNYEVSISSGKADCVLTWDSSKVEIDKYFLGKLDPSQIKKQSEGSLTFTMDQTGGTGDYLIPFYIKGSIPDSWSEMEKIVTFKATEQTN